MGQPISQQYVQRVADMPQLQHAAVRVGLWIAAVAERTGGFPITVYNSDFINGYLRDGVKVSGISFRPETVTKSLESLQAEGLLEIKEHPPVRFGHVKKEMTLTLHRPTRILRDRVAA